MTTMHRRTRSIAVVVAVAVGLLAVLALVRSAALTGGSVWDPRTITLRSEVHGELLVIRADYWSRPAAP